ncbi:hypothetical protein CVT26_015569 [Gymnopilus dilepis]|uniref:Uncharacterized protein n=1 Tax=Gymnopilus dilepis TaxID=231916 RepID=A0A409XYM6_9AGAR|nr:hypothetical protein CVT26_015569 [Gymnopilus dilepis]
MSTQDSSRPPTPESPLANSLYHATSTIDELTAALANFSRVPSPEPVSALTCCCGKEDCENLKSWLDLKSRLDSRLVLSAEVGQALLQRHAAYVRQHERKLRREDDPFSTNRAEAQSASQSSMTEDLHREIDELTKEKAVLEKRLNQALVNNEVTEVSNKTILQELQEARETISRLTAHHARSVGWDTRLSAALKERDDMQQERDSETHRARLAESRFAALKEKTNKLQAEVRRLQESLEEKRHSRLESSETILRDAKSRLDSFRNSQVGLTAKAAEEELTSVLESLVQDNEILKHDNAELQHLLADAREDVNALQLEVDEQRALAPPPRSGANTPHSRHFHTGSVPSLKDFKLRRNASIESRSRRVSGGAPGSIDLHLNNLTVPLREPLTPDTARSPDSSFAAYAPLSPRSSHISFEIEEDAEKEQEENAEKSRGYKPLFLLTRSRGVQTDAQASTSTHSARSGAMSPSPLPSTLSPYEHQSETSSFSEPHSHSHSSPSTSTNTTTSHLTLILERISQLLNRLTQSDAHTLTNRLKRQNLKVKPADVSHLSRTTISHIVSEALALRGQFRGLLEDENATWVCGRKEVRALLKVVKEVFEEMGALRVVVNDVILDPGSAKRVSELGMSAAGGLGLGLVLKGDRKEKEEAGGGVGEGVAAWMSPFSKLFSPTTNSAAGGSVDRNAATSPGPSGSGLNPRDRARPARFVPKLGPALAASATTVNVEFSGTGVGRSVTSTFTEQGAAMPVLPLAASESTSSADTSLGGGAGSGLMGIFAGAPAPRIADPDPWIVVPPAPPSALGSAASVTTSTSNIDSARTVRKVPSRIFGRVIGASGTNANDLQGTTTIGRSTGRRNLNRLSRNVDAVIDHNDHRRTSVDRPSGAEGGDLDAEEDEEPDYVPPLLERTLRRRGLSDSSIHSTFSSHGAEQAQSPSSPKRSNGRGPASRKAMPDFWGLGLGQGDGVGSVFQALGRTVQGWRSASGAHASGVTSADTDDAGPSPASAYASHVQGPAPSTPKKDRTSASTSRDHSRGTPISSPMKSRRADNSDVTTTSSSILPNLSLSSWAASNVADPVIASSLREESYIHRMAASGASTLRGGRGERARDGVDGHGYHPSGRDFY